MGGRDGVFGRPISYYALAVSRRNLAGHFGESRVVSVRLSRRDLDAARRLQEAWGIGFSEALRRALQEAARRLGDADNKGRR